jgi:hypothetical protein
VRALVPLEMAERPDQHDLVTVVGLGLDHGPARVRADVAGTPDHHLRVECAQARFGRRHAGEDISAAKRPDFQIPYA